VQCSDVKSGPFAVEEEGKDWTAFIKPGREPDKAFLGSCALWQNRFCWDFSGKSVFLSLSMGTV